MKIANLEFASMGNKKSRDAMTRRSKRERHAPDRQTKRGSSTSARFVKPDIHGEIRYITERARAGDSRIVSLANLVLFSTRSQDAWLLDPEDDFAVCLCREGEPQSFRIVDAPDSFAIEWPATFAIEGTKFIVHDRAGGAVVIDGYPTEEIAVACRGEET